MRTFGIELELGDVRTVELAEFVLAEEGLAFQEWKDRGRNSKIREYGAWNVQSDPTLYNTNGTVCMYTVMEDGEKKKLTSTNKHLQQGAEIVSPVLTDIEEGLAKLEKFVTYAVTAGAVARPDLKHALHVHVGIEDFDLEDVKSLMLWQHEHGKNFFKVFPGYAEGKFTKRGYWDWLIEKISNAETVEELWELYRVRTSTGKTTDNEFAYRKDINPAHWLENKAEGLDRPLTVEFRAFGATTDVDLIEDIVKSCIRVVDSIKEKK